MLELYVHIFVKHYVIYVTLWPLEKWYSVQKASIDSFCATRNIFIMNNECQLCDILLKVVS